MALGSGPRPNALVVVISALVGLVVRVALRVGRLDRVTAVLRLAARTARRPATTQETLYVLRAVDAGARLLPVRIACLERSVSTVLILAARRRGVTFCTGVKTPPLAAHAWVADPQGTPIGEPSTTAEFRPLLTISSTTTNRSTT
ncbi:lasso peptide biosynthesis B2 protein [Lentzea atacamensis]|uniref:lasso peptide biosynthesis B2 protein n=1 Tax=Lentzea atacamensis TaxID=531938 RepID=UPI003898E1DF